MVYIFKGPIISWRSAPRVNNSVAYIAAPVLDVTPRTPCTACISTGH